VLAGAAALGPGVMALVAAAAKRSAWRVKRSSRTPAVLASSDIGQLQPFRDRDD
jgi:hypothetical protein